jgi:hypothetical protein
MAQAFMVRSRIAASRTTKAAPKTQPVSFVVRDGLSGLLTMKEIAGIHDEENLRAQPLQPPLNHHLFNLGNRLGRVQAFRAGLRAVHDGVAAVKPERILKIVEPLALGLIA